MTLDQENHAHQIADAFRSRMLSKYKRGVEEHGGNLWEYSPDDLLEEAIDEAVDQLVYLLTLKHKYQVAAGFSKAPALASKASAFSSDPRQSQAGA